MPRRVLHHAITAVPDDQRDTRGDDDVYRRKEDCVVENRIEICFAKIAINALEFVQFVLFTIEQLDYRHARESFLQKRADARDVSAHRAKRTARTQSKPGRYGDERRQHKQRHERQAPVEQEHPEDDVKQHREIAEKCDHDGSEEFVDCFDVAGQTRHHLSDRVAVVKLNGQSLQVGEDLVAQIEHNVLAHSLQQDRLGIKHKHRGEVCDHQQQSNERDS